MRNSLSVLSSVAGVNNKILYQCPVTIIVTCIVTGCLYTKKKKKKKKKKRGGGGGGGGG